MNTSAILSELALSERPTSDEIESALLELNGSMQELDTTLVVRVISKAKLDPKGRAQILECAMACFEMTHGINPKAAYAFSVIVRRLLCDDLVEETVAELRRVNTTAFTPITAVIILEKKFASVTGMAPIINLLMPRLVSVYHGGDPMQGLLGLGSDGEDEPSLS